jgi:hypothetical protein
MLVILRLRSLLSFLPTSGATTAILPKVLTERRSLSDSVFASLSDGKDWLETTQLLIGFGEVVGDAVEGARRICVAASPRRFGFEDPEEMSGESQALPSGRR